MDRYDFTDSDFSSFKYQIPTPQSEAPNEFKTQIIFDSVLHGDIPEEVAHALLVVDPSDGLCQEDRDVHGLDLVSL